MRKRRALPTLYLACLVGGVGVLALHLTANVGGHATDSLFDVYLYNGLMFAATGAVLLRGLTIAAQRRAWLAMGAGLAFWSLGELYYSLFLEGAGGGGPGVSPADGMFLAMYPCMYVGLVLLVRANVRELRMSMCLDGLIVALAVAGVAAALFLPPILAGAHGEGASLTISLAYPVGDIVLLMFTISALGMTGWRPGRVWLLIAASMVISAVADSVYLYDTAIGAFESGTWLEGLWPASAVVLAIAAWTPWPRTARRRIEDWRLVLAPAIALVVALGMLSAGALSPGWLTAVAVALAAAAVLAACARLMLTVRENLTMLAGSRQMALTDPLTGLGNRRRLMEDLQVACRVSRPERPSRLVIYDLNGFKAYNDAFGHPAGDALLARLSARLQATVIAHGTAYRMGGDEFCVLLRGSRTVQQALEQASVRALSERGPHHAIGAAYGGVDIPGEAGQPGAALKLADERLYRSKVRQPALGPLPGTVAANGGPALQPVAPAPTPGAAAPHPIPAPRPSAPARSKPVTA
jgi:diguanylate cyclase (GGDEF)-like protein